MKKKLIELCIVILLVTNSLPGWASPWTSGPRYRDRIEGKFVFGLKHTLFSWMTPWAEANDHQYETPWTGFCVGIGKAFVYTAAGMIQLVTFPIPIDFPDIGMGMHIPANHSKEKNNKNIPAPIDPNAPPASAEMGAEKQAVAQPLTPPVPASQPLIPVAKPTQEKPSAIPPAVGAATPLPPAAPKPVQAAPTTPQPSQEPPLAPLDEAALLKTVK